MKALVLAAGLGTRLRPLTENTPKALLLVDGRPLIYYSLKLLQRHGIKDVVINLHYLGDLIQKELGDGSKFDLRIRYSWEPEILGTGGGVKKASKFLDHDGFFVLNSDVLIDVDLKDLHRDHKKKKALATMVLRNRGQNSSFTPVWVGRANRVLGIGEDETLAHKKGVRPFFFTGVHFLESRFLDFLQSDGESCIIRQGYQPAIAQGERINGYLYDGIWNDLGTFERLRDAEHDLKSGRVRLSFL